MSLEKKYIRDGKQRIIGSVTNGFDDTTAVIRDEHNKLPGAPTTDSTPPATNTGTWCPSIPDPGLLIGKRK